MTPKEAALQYAHLGWPVLPIHTPDEGICSCGRAACPDIGKHPRTIHGLKDASTDPPEIERRWGMWPDANVAIVTGAASRLVVLDVDRHGEVDGVAGLEAKLNGENPPQTLTVETGGGGLHYYFRLPDGGMRSRKLPDMGDLKCDDTPRKP